jgi:hypothetical protein
MVCVAGLCVGGLDRAVDMLPVGDMVREKACASLETHAARGFISSVFPGGN